MKKEHKKMSPETQHKIAVVLATLIRISIICLIICIVVCVGRACVISCSAASYVPGEATYTTLFISPRITSYPVGNVNPDYPVRDGQVAYFTTSGDISAGFYYYNGSQWVFEEVYYGFVLYYSIDGYSADGYPQVYLYAEDAESGTRLFTSFDNTAYPAGGIVPIVIHMPSAQVSFNTTDTYARDIADGLLIAGGIDTEEAYQQGYNYGQSIGFESGQRVSYQNGYNDGKRYAENAYAAQLTSEKATSYEAGKAAGESIGYNRGVEESENYNFGSMINAVVSAPIQLISSMFDVEILGMNMQTIFFGLIITLTVVALAVILLRLLK